MQRVILLLIAGDIVRHAEFRQWTSASDDEGRARFFWSQ